MADTPAAPPLPRFPRLRAAGPALLAVAVFALGAIALSHLLHGVDLHAVGAQVRATPPLSIALACLATALGYCALIAYDWTALRHIGKPLPLPAVALGGYMAYAIGNTVGLSALSGNAIRYRVYSAHGLRIMDIAAIGAFTGMAFGIGLAVVGLGSSALDPGVVAGRTGLTPGAVRAGALALLTAIGGTLVWLSRGGKTLRLGGFALAAPTLRVMALQLAIGLADLLLTGATLYLLLGSVDVPFTGFLAVYAAAIVIALISHVPGGIGVFETVMIAGLGGQVPPETLAAGLLLYRAIYYLGPFALALVLLGAMEARRARGALAPVQAAMRGAVPVVMAAMTLVSGVFLLLSTLLPFDGTSLRHVRALLPLEALEAGAMLASAIGAVLVLVAHGLLHRNQGAFWIACAALATGAGASLLHGLDIGRAVVLAACALILFTFRGQFQRPARLAQAPLSPAWVALVAGIVITGLFVLFFAHKAQPYSTDLWWRFAFDASAPRGMRAGLLASMILGVGLVFMTLRPARLPDAPPDAETMARAARLVAAQSDPDANLAFTGDKRLMISPAGDAMILYAVSGRSWIAFGNPVGPREAAGALAWAFRDAAIAAGGRPVFYQIDTTQLPLFIDMGLALHKLGEEAVVSLAGFGLEGSARKSMRTVYNRAGRDGLTLDIVSPPHDPALIAELRAVSDDWLDAKNTREKRFSVGRFDAAYLDRFALAVARRGGSALAFANVMTTGTKQRATIDLMRHVEDIPNGTMDFLFTELMLRLKAEGYAEFTLGMAPLSGLSDRAGAPLWNRMGAAVARHGDALYGFEGLRRFKNKFDPEWRPRYLACESHLPPLSALADTTVLIAGGVRGIVGK